MPIIITGPTGAPTGFPGLVTLADIERELARRTGPVRLGAGGIGEVAGSGSMATSVTIAALMSTVDAGGLENLYLLRRGRLENGTAVTVVSGDRQRIVDQVDASLGRVSVDRNWATPPVAGELVEFHHLDPANELRPAVLAGLRRCYFEDRVTVTLSGASAERDLSAEVPWLTRRSQLRRVQFSMAGSTSIPSDQTWWNAFDRSGGVWLAGWRDAYPNALEVTALRPVSSWVNGADSTTGPVLDDDTLSVELGYAVAAAHIEAWRLFPSRMRAAAEAGYQASQQDAAAEFTRAAAANVRRRPREWGLSSPFGLPSLSSVAQ